MVVLGNMHSVTNVLYRTRQSLFVVWENIIRMESLKLALRLPLLELKHYCCMLNVIGLRQLQLCCGLLLSWSLFAHRIILILTKMASPHICNLSQ